MLDLETRINKQKDVMNDLWQMFAYNFTFWFCPIEKKSLSNNRIFYIVL